MTRAQQHELATQFAASTAVAKRLFETHSPTELTRRPRLDAWSAAECVVHLSLTAEAVLPLAEAAIRDLRQANRHTEWPSRMDFVGWAIASSLEPRWMRTKTAARFEPVHLGPPQEVLPRFLGNQDRIVAAIDSAEHLDLGAARITSPFNEKIRYNVLSAFRILETHERRHLRQAQAALATR